MSGFSTEESCPNCGKDCDVYTDWKPYSYSSIQCVHCGFQLIPVVQYMDLETLNDYRQDNELEPLDKLPEQTFKD